MPKKTSLHDAIRVNVWLVLAVEVVGQSSTFFGEYLAYVNVIRLMPGILLQYGAAISGMMTEAPISTNLATSRLWS